MKPLHSVIEQQIDNYISEKVTITDAYQFSQYETIQQIENFMHSKFTSGQVDSRGNPKPFFNITKGKVNIAIRATDNGKILQGAGTNGTTSKINLPALGIGTASARSVSFWTKPTGTGAGVMYAQGAGTSQADFNIFASGNTANDIYIQFNGGDYFTPTGQLTTSAFTHVVVVYDGGLTSVSTVHVT